MTITSANNLLSEKSQVYFTIVSPEGGISYNASEYQYSRLAKIGHWHQNKLASGKVRLDNLTNSEPEPRVPSLKGFFSIQEVYTKADKMGRGVGWRGEGSSI